MVAARTLNCTPRTIRRAVIEIVTIPVGIGDRVHGRGACGLGARDLAPSDDPTINRLIRRLQTEVREERAARRDSRRGITANEWCNSWRQ